MKRGSLSWKKSSQGGFLSACIQHWGCLADSRLRQCRKGIRDKVRGSLALSLILPRIERPYGEVENTVLPPSYTPPKFPFGEYPPETSQLKNMLLMTTIPVRFDGEPPDPDGHSEWIVHAQTKNKVLNTPGYPQPVPKFPPGLVEVKSTPSMGKGVFATRDILLGEIVFASSHIMFFEREQQLEVAVGRMEPDRKEKLMALANSHLEDGSGPIYGIVRTNGYALNELREGAQREESDYCTVVCDIGSRINHSCLPNVLQVFKLSAFAIIFMATRDIKSGEQLFFPYCGLQQSAAERKEKLAPYGIDQCTCSACVNATPQTDAIRRTFYARVKEYKTQSKIWGALPTLPVGILDELLAYQKAIVKEGFNTDDYYWMFFMPALEVAYRESGRREGLGVMHGIMRFSGFWEKRKSLQGLV